MRALDVRGVTAAVIVAWLAAGIPAHGTRQGSLKTQEEAVVHGNIRTWSSAPGIQGLEHAFEYLARTDLAALPLGRTEIEGDDVYVLLSEAETRPPDQVQFEAHRRYIDIQMVVRGQESIGVTPVAGLVTTEPYDPARDIEFFAIPPQSQTLALDAGNFAVFTPKDAHRPSLHFNGPHVSRKAVVKVSVAYRERQRAAVARQAAPEGPAFND